MTMADDLDMWWLQRPQQTPYGYAFDTDNPIVNFLRRMNSGGLAPQQYVASTPWLRESLRALLMSAPGLRARIPVGIANVPGTITGGRPNLWSETLRTFDYPPISNSSSGLIGRYAHHMDDNLNNFGPFGLHSSGWPYRPHSGLPWPEGLLPPANINVPRLR